MKSLKNQFRFVLLSVSLLVLSAISVPADAVDDFVRARMAERNIPGAAIAVIRNGKLIKAKGYGVASVEFGVPASTETVFEIGSVSKQITAVGILILMEEGKLQLDEKISKYLPNTPPAWSEVSVRNLLNHTSGIKSYSSLTGFDLSKRMKRDDFIKALSPHPLEFETGTNYIYSNSGYNLLSFIIESASGQGYWDFLRQRIFNPLGMTKTGDRDPQFVTKNRANGYEWRTGRLVGRDYSLTDLFGAGAITSTILDLVKWDAAIRGDKLLKKETKAEMWKPLVFKNGKTYPYGLGWRFSDIRGHKLVAHSGQTSGFGASISKFVDNDLTVIALTNLGETGMGTMLAFGAAKLYLPTMSLRTMKPLPESSADLSEKFGRALRQRLENKFSTEIYGESLIQSLSNDRTKAVHARIAAVGPVKRTDFVGSETTDGKTVHRYRVEAGKRYFLWRVAVQTDGKLSEMTLEEEE